MLSFDIQVEIIKRFPVKSLIQFRSVCKAWKSLIDSSKFIAGYNVRHDHLLIRYEVGFDEKKELKYVSFVDDDSFPQQKSALTFPPPFQEAILIGISHGLLCLTGYYHDSDDSSDMQIAVLWNPAIKKSIVVDVPNMVREPLTSALGFGGCPDTKDPKLIKINTYNVHDDVKFEGIICIPYQVMVFSLSSGEWTCICSGSLAAHRIFFTNVQTVIGQFIYWGAIDSIHRGDGDLRHLIMSFDMSSGKFREVDLPNSLVGVRESEFTFSRLRDSLAVFEYNLAGKRVCTVWMMMEEHGKAFTKLFTINLPNASVSKILGFRKNGEPIVEIQDDHRHYDSAPVVYEPCSKHIKDLGVGIRGNNYSFFGSFYTESLLLLDHDDGRIISCEELT